MFNIFEKFNRLEIIIGAIAVLVLMYDCEQLLNLFFRLK